MSMYLRYSGGFLSRAGAVWRCDIYQDADAAYSTVGDLDFPADEPLLIEWEHRDKEDVIHGSTATIKIISPGDRTYADLYSVTPASIRLDVYKDGELYWSGCLDSEFYEEPYRPYNNYEVTLTFSDFGILRRIKYDTGSTYRTLKGIVQQALNRAGINYSEIDESLISTQLDSSTAMTLDSIRVRSDNFVDEDGEVNTLYDVILGAFQPLGLKIIQRSGKIYVFDLNGLYGAENTQEIYWTSDSQTMGVDKAVNNVKITFSPYSNADLLDGSLEYKGDYSLDLYNLKTTGDYFSFYPDTQGSVININFTGLGLPMNLPLSSKYGSDLVDFTIFTGSSAEGAITKGSACSYFQIQPVLGSASDDCGVAYAFRVGHDSVKSGNTVWKIHTSVPSAPSETVFQTSQVYLPGIAWVDRTKFLIRYQQQILVDCRYNPFQDASDDNELDNYNEMREYGQFVFIPVKIELLDSSGNVTYHLKNVTYASQASIGSISYTQGTWTSGEDSGGDCWLEYYSQQAGKAGSKAFAQFLGGWITNRHCVGRPDGHSDRLPWIYFDSFEKMDDGEYIPYPPVGGYLRITVLDGIKGFDYQTGKTNDTWDACTWRRKGVYDDLRWMLYKAPELALVKFNQVFSEAKLEDIVYNGYINSDAKEGIELDTICGSLEETAPMARGAYFRASDGLQISTLTRAGRTLAPEKLFIGTLCSQYGGRMTVLSGEARMDGGLLTYTEANQRGKRFMLTASSEDAITDCTDAEITEIRPDEYDEEQITEE